MGGGHHITRADYDIERLEKCIMHMRDKYDLEIYLEPGEAVALDAGYLETTVLDIVENNGIKILILDTSAACHMPDVLEMPYRPPLMDSGEPGEKKYTYRLSSCTCLAGDVIGDYSFDREINKEMILNGSSEFIGEMASAISMFMFNYVLMKYVGAEGVAAFTILGFVVYGYSMICIGFGQGISPLVSRCWGAKEKEMAFALRKTTNKMLFMIGLIIAIAFFVAGKQYAGLFGCNNKVADMVATGFKIYAVTFLTMGYNVVNSMYFTSCGDAGSSAIISTLRGIVFLLGFTLVFPAILGMTGVWLTAPCSETLTAIIAVFLIRKQTGKRKCGELNG
mgnify:CR=1 FL=1